MLEFKSGRVIQCQCVGVLGVLESARVEVLKRSCVILLIRLCFL